MKALELFLMPRYEADSIITYLLTCRFYFSFSFTKVRNYIPKIGSIIGEKGRGERASDGLEFYLRLVLFFSRILLPICAIIENRDAPPFAF